MSWELQMRPLDWQKVSLGETFLEVFECGC